MDQEIVNLFIGGSEKYHDYLNMNNRGYVEIGLNQKVQIDGAGRIWELNLKKKIFDLDLIVIRNQNAGQEYGKDEFSVLEYDSLNGVLIVQLSEVDLNFTQAQPHHIFVISSLLFLIKNVQQWYEKNGLDISIPTVGNQRLGTDALNVLEDPNQEQKEAIKTSLSSPLSYIWGAPGTGKTRLVLTQSVLELIQDPNAQVGLFAPTNIALEQAMEALLEAAAELHISKERFIRLGAPSTDFAQEYPEVCEIQGLERKIKEVERQIKILKVAINSRAAINALHSGESMLIVLEQIAELFKKRDFCIERNMKLETALEVNEEKLRKIITKLRRFFSDSPLPEERKSESIKLEMMQVKQDQDGLEEKIQIRVSEFRTIPTQRPKIKKLQEDFHPRKWGNVSDSLKVIIRKAEDWLATDQAIIKPYEEVSREELLERKNKAEEDLQILMRGSVNERIRRCSVVGMTLDLYIGRFRQSAPKFDHIFLDEAGYASIIKALTLFRFNTPITMLGDHKQLPPIVEMKDQELDMPEYARVRLWGISAIFSEKALLGNMPADHFLDQIWQADRQNELDFEKTSMITLKQTHRFGENLSMIIDSLFYRFGFSSANTNNLNIQFLDAPQISKPIGRANNEECAAIAAIEKGLGDDFAIITPYREQVSVIGNRFPNLRDENRVLTIHRSQGREWSTVVVSVADGSRQPKGPWFTNTQSETSRGAQVMNTAVSRAKNRLVLVCDVQYWKNRRRDRQHQLISRLLDVALPFNDNGAGG